MTKPAPSICVFLHSPSGGGATRRTITLIEGFVARGCRVEFVVLSKEGPMAERVPDAVTVTVLDSPVLRLAGRIRKRARRRTIAASTFALARHLRRTRPDVLLSAANHVHLSAIAAAKISRTGTRLVLRVSNHLTRSHLGASGVQRPIRLRWARWLYGRADAAVCVSRGIAHDLAATTALPEDAIVAIPNPTWTPGIEAAAQEPLDHPWFASGAPPVVLAAGRLAVAKDFETLLRAFAILRRERRLRLVILGEGRLRESLEESARALGVSADVALPGRVDNPFAWMARAAVFALSSAWEGSPGVLIEAMACGCPVVSTDCESGPDEILEAGRFGPLVPVGDAAALARATLETLDAPPDPDLLRARAREFAVDGAVERTLAVLLPG